MPIRAQDDPKHDIGIWLPIALADIYTTLLASYGAKDIPTNIDVLNGWQLTELAKALGGPVKTKPHRQGGEYGSELATLFAKELK